MEARLTWLVKLVRPVTTISWGGEWIMETKVLFGLGYGSPVLSLGRYRIWTRFSVGTGRETRVGPRGAREITGYRFNNRFQHRFRNQFQGLIQEANPRSDFKKWFFDCLFPFCESSARNLNQR